jgi:hypothetical protein
MKRIIVFSLILSFITNLALCDEQFKEYIDEISAITCVLSITQEPVQVIVYPDRKNPTVEKIYDGGLQPCHNYVINWSNGKQAIPLLSARHMEIPLLTRSRPIFKVLSAKKIKDQVYVFYIEGRASRLLRTTIPKDGALPPVEIAELEDSDFFISAPSIVEKSGTYYISAGVTADLSLTDLSWKPRQLNAPVEKTEAGKP